MFDKSPQNMFDLNLGLFLSVCKISCEERRGEKFNQDLYVWYQNIFDQSFIISQERSIKSWLSILRLEVQILGNNTLNSPLCKHRSKEYPFSLFCHFGDQIVFRSLFCPYIKKGDTIKNLIVDKCFEAQSIMSS